MPEAESESAWPLEKSRPSGFVPGAETESASLPDMLGRSAVGFCLRQKPSGMLPGARTESAEWTCQMDEEDVRVEVCPRQKPSWILPQAETE